MSFNRIISRIPAVAMRSMRTTPSSAAAASVLASSSSTSTTTTPIRFFASGGGGKKQKKPEDLATILANELEYEKNEAEPRAPLTEVKESMKEWTFKDELGSARFSCSKTVSKHPSTQKKSRETTKYSSADEGTTLGVFY